MLLCSLRGVDGVGLLKCVRVRSSLEGLVPLDMHQVMGQVTQKYEDFWKRYEQVDSFRQDFGDGHKTLTYAKCFKPEAIFPSLPAYFMCDQLTPSDVARVARFRVGSHNLRVETGRWSGARCVGPSFVFEV